LVVVVGEGVVDGAGVVDGSAVVDGGGVVVAMGARVVVVGAAGRGSVAAVGSAPLHAASIRIAAADAATFRRIGRSVCRRMRMGREGTPVRHHPAAFRA
jgi:hypothetical protein